MIGDDDVRDRKRRRAPARGGLNIVPAAAIGRAAGAATRRATIGAEIARAIRLPARNRLVRKIECRSSPKLAVGAIAMARSSELLTTIS